MDLNEIQSLIKFVSKSGANEVELETKDFKITIKTDGPKKKNQRSGDEPQQTVVHTQMPMATMPPMPTQQMAPQPAVPQSQEQPTEEQKRDSSNKQEEQDDSKYVTVKSPMIGTFYRAPSPDKPPFKNVGDTIAEGDVVCIIEAMKLFNEIEAEISGKIVKVLVDDATPVEYDQPLFLVDPS